MQWKPSRCKQKKYGRARETGGETTTCTINQPQGPPGSPKNYYSGNVYSRVTEAGVMLIRTNFRKLSARMEAWMGVTIVRKISIMTARVMMTQKIIMRMI